jgi:hypothetical protein
MANLARQYGVRREAISKLSVLNSVTGRVLTFVQQGR